MRLGEAVLGKASDLADDDELKLSYDQSVKATALLAAGRLDWLLQSTRPNLSGLFSEHDIATLLDCYQGDILYPDLFNSIASDLCDHLGNLGVCIVDDVGHHVPKTFPRCPKVSDDVVGR